MVMPSLFYRLVKHSPRVSAAAALLLIALGFLLSVQSVTAQYAVSPGGLGSYSSSVPAVDQNVDGYYGLTAAEVTGDNSIFDLIKLDPSLTGKPLETNRWWTDLLVGNRSVPYTDSSGNYLHTLSQGKITDNLSGLYGGQMWFYPGMLVPRSYGFDLYYPIAWQNNPTTAAVDPGPALQVHGDRGYTVPPDDVLVADFETSYPQGWTITSFTGYTNPFGTVPAQASWGHTLSGAIGNGRVDTEVMAAGKSSNGYRGMISGSFTVQKHYLNLLVGGGKDPVNLYVDLKDTNGNVIYTATGAQSTTLLWVTWDISAYAGQAVTIEIVDNSSAAYGFIACDEIVQSDSNTPATRYGVDLIAEKSVVTNWGDWNVDFELGDGTGLATDVTMVRGIPFTWSTWEGGLKPKIAGLSGVQFLDEGGNAISTSSGSFVASAFAFHLPGTRVRRVSARPHHRRGKFRTARLNPNSPARTTTWSSATCPRPPTWRNSRPWPTRGPRTPSFRGPTIRPDGFVATNWNITTTAMKGINLNTIQGWLPHHYRTTTNNPNFSSYTYLTATGPMKCATGNNFTINFPFHGIAPVLPTPVTTGAVNDFQPARMQQYLTGFNPGTMIGGDTYNSGKSLGVCSQLMTEAAEFGDTTDFNRLKTALETSLADWLTYTPGEENNAGGAYGYFARYDDWHALVGFNPSYGTQTFNDLHFHYGYYIRTLGLLGMYDPAVREQLRADGPGHRQELQQL